MTTQDLFGAFRSPRYLIMGPGQRRALARYALECGSKALVVTDARMAADAEFKALVASVEAAGIAVTVFDGTIAELPLECIAAGVELGRGAGVDVIVGIGGGSCLDAAKVIALLLAHGGKASDYYGEFKVPGPTLPVIALPTTAGTGSEVTPVAVLADAERAVKIGIASPHLIPHVAICDPELTYTCPPSLTAHSGADAMTHAIEAFTNLRRPLSDNLAHEHVFLGKNMLSDQFALSAIADIAMSLRQAVENGGDKQARQRLMSGATKAGLAFGTAGTAAAHAVQYPVGAMTHTAHGLGVAVLMPHVMAFNRNYCEAELAQIADAMEVGSGGVSERAGAAIEGVAALFASVGIPRTLADLGIVRDQLPTIVEQALGSVRLVKNNPRPLDAATMAILVEGAFTGDHSGYVETVQKKAV
jgi:alcohol dehydrogenase class IV